MSYIWDPELWVKFREAVALDEPWRFWNKLMDRVEYSEYLGGLCGY
jgi:cell division protease FtsH